MSALPPLISLNNALPK